MYPYNKIGGKKDKKKTQQWGLKRTVINPCHKIENEFMHLFVFRILKPRSLMIGMSARRSTIPMTRNRRTGTSLSTSLTPTPRSPRIGTMRWTASGSPL
jgi:hypothetical protein